MTEAMGKLQKQYNEAADVHHILEMDKIKLDQAFLGLMRLDKTKAILQLNIQILKNISQDLVNAFNSLGVQVKEIKKFLDPHDKEFSLDLSIDAFGRCLDVINASAPLVSWTSKNLSTVSNNFSFFSNQKPDKLEVL
jgi:hypothetical protein